MKSKENQILKIILIAAVVVAALAMWIWKPNDPFKILALLGALSWIVLISDLVIRLFIKPKITLILGKEIELGFNSLGPIVNNQIAILSENKPSLINNIEVQLKHESNATYKLDWQWFEEKLYEMLSSDNLQNINARKNQKATAIRVNSDEMIEKKIGFQRLDYLNEFHKLRQLLTKKYMIITSNQDAKLEDLKSASEYDDLRQFANNSFLWNVGKYELTYKVYVLGIDKPFEAKQSFELTDIDISTLNLNLELVHKSIDVTYGLVDEKQPIYFWVHAQES